MAKLTAWLVTLIGVLFILQLIWPMTFVVGKAGVWVSWIIALSVLLIGIGKLVRNYNYKPLMKKR